MSEAPHRARERERDVSLQSVMSKKNLEQSQKLSQEFSLFFSGKVFRRRPSKKSSLFKLLFCVKRRTVLTPKEKYIFKNASTLREKKFSSLCLSFFWSTWLTSLLKTRPCKLHFSRVNHTVTYSTPVAESFEAWRRPLRPYEGQQSQSVRQMLRLHATILTDLWTCTKNKLISSLSNEQHTPSSFSYARALTPCNALAL